MKESEARSNAPVVAFRISVRDSEFILSVISFL